MARAPLIADIVSAGSAFTLPTHEENVVETRRLVEKLTRQMEKVAKQTEKTSREVARVRKQLEALEAQVAESDGDIYNLTLLVAKFVSKGPTNGRPTALMVQELWYHAGLDRPT